MIKIKVIAYPGANEYFSEIYGRFSTNVTVDYTNTLAGIDKTNCDLVHLHWPEFLFNFRQPSEEALITLEHQLAQLPSLVVTRHNFLPHRFANEVGRRLYEMVYRSAQGIIHMGEFSKLNYFELYPSFADRQQHQIIPHPLYSSYENSASDEAARDFFGIGNSQKVIMVFGRLRYKEELDFIRNVFKGLEVSNKALLISRVDFLNRDNRIVRRLRTIKNYVYAHYRKVSHSEYLNFKRVPDRDVQYYLKAADVVFVPRTDSLNSGIPLLAWSFGKVVVAPDSGNISEALTYMNQPLFEMGNVASAIDAVHKGLASTSTEESVKARAGTKFSPDQIAKDTENYLRSFLPVKK